MLGSHVQCEHSVDPPSQDHSGPHAHSRESSKTSHQTGTQITQEVEAASGRCKPCTRCFSVIISWCDNFLDCLDYKKVEVDETHARRHSRRLTPASLVTETHKNFPTSRPDIVAMHPERFPLLTRKYYADTFFRGRHGGHVTNELIPSREAFQFTGILRSHYFGRMYVARLQQVDRYSTVSMCDKRLWVKVNSKSSEIAVKSIKNELTCMLLVTDRPFFLKLKGQFQTPFGYYIVTPAQGVCSFEDVHEITAKVTYEMIRFYAAEIAVAVAFLHDNKIIYRLNASSVMLDHQGHALLTDFAFVSFSPTSTIKCYGADVHYMAPELINGSVYTISVDWWSLGVLLYLLIFGQLPFQGHSPVAVLASVLEQEPRFRTRAYPSDVISFCKSIRPCVSLTVYFQLLHKHPGQRLGTGDLGNLEVFGHQLFRSITWDQLKAKEVTPPFVPPADVTVNLRDWDQMSSSVCSARSDVSLAEWQQVEADLEEAETETYLSAPYTSHRAGRELQRNARQSISGLGRALVEHPNFQRPASPRSPRSPAIARNLHASKLSPIQEPRSQQTRTGEPGPFKAFKDTLKIQGAEYQKNQVPVVFNVRRLNVELPQSPDSSDTEGQPRLKIPKRVLGTRPVGSNSKQNVPVLLHSQGPQRGSNYPPILNRGSRTSIHSLYSTDFDARTHQQQKGDKKDGNSGAGVDTQSSEITEREGSGAISCVQILHSRSMGSLDNNSDLQITDLHRDDNENSLVYPESPDEFNLLSFVSTRINADNHVWNLGGTRRWTMVCSANSDAGDDIAGRTISPKDERRTLADGNTNAARSVGHEDDVEDEEDDDNNLKCGCFLLNAGHRNYVSNKRFPISKSSCSSGHGRSRTNGDSSQREGARSGNKNNKNSNDSDNNSNDSNNDNSSNNNSGGSNNPGENNRNGRDDDIDDNNNRDGNDNADDEEEDTSNEDDTSDTDIDDENGSSKKDSAIKNNGNSQSRQETDRPSHSRTTGQGTNSSASSVPEAGKTATFSERHYGDGTLKSALGTQNLEIKSDSGSENHARAQTPEHLTDQRQSVINQENNTTKKADGIFPELSSVGIRADFNDLSPESNPLEGSHSHHATVLSLATGRGDMQGVRPGLRYTGGMSNVLDLCSGDSRRDHNVHTNITSVYHHVDAVRTFEPGVHGSSRWIPSAGERETNSSCSGIYENIPSCSKQLSQGSDPGLMYSKIAESTTAKFNVEMTTEWGHSTQLDNFIFPMKCHTPTKGVTQASYHTQTSLSASAEHEESQQERVNTGLQVIVQDKRQMKEGHTLKESSRGSEAMMGLQFFSLLTKELEKQGQTDTGSGTGKEVPKPVSSHCHDKPYDRENVGTEEEMLIKLRNVENSAPKAASNSLIINTELKSSPDVTVEPPPVSSRSHACAVSTAPDENDRSKDQFDKEKNTESSSQKSKQMNKLSKYTLRFFSIRKIVRNAMSKDSRQNCKDNKLTGNSNPLSAYKVDDSISEIRKTEATIDTLIDSDQRLPSLLNDCDRSSKAPVESCQTSDLVQNTKASFSVQNAAEGMSQATVQMRPQFFHQTNDTDSKPFIDFATEAFSSESKTESVAAVEPEVFRKTRSVQSFRPRSDDQARDIARQPTGLTQAPLTFNQDSTTEPMKDHLWKEKGQRLPTTTIASNNTVLQEADNDNSYRQERIKRASQRRQRLIMEMDEITPCADVYTPSFCDIRSFAYASKYGISDHDFGIHKQVTTCGSHVHSHSEGHKVIGTLTIECLKPPVEGVIFLK